MAILGASDHTVFFFLLISIFLAPQARSEDAPLNSMDMMSLKVEGAASIGLDQMLQLTKEYNGNIGHFSSPQLIHLWDKSTSKLANFNTTFDFFIDGARRGDGLAFFLASPEVTVPEEYSMGTCLGLEYQKSTQDHPTYNKVVALEIGTTKIECDPKEKLVLGGRIPKEYGNKRLGIYIRHRMSGWNSMCLICDEQQFQGTVKFEYDSSSKELKADITTLRCNDENLYNILDISCPADLRLHLPEYVKIGFSVATGFDDDHQAASYRIANWSFNSSL